MSAKLQDLAERCIWTFIQAFAAYWIAAAANIVQPEFEWVDGLKLAAIAGGIAVAKAVVAFQFGNSESAALPETHP